jgi:hypothetical protein
VNKELYLFQAKRPQCRFFVAAAAFLFGMVSANAEWKDPVLPSQDEIKRLDNQSDRIYAEVLSTTPEGKKIAYLGYRGYAAYYQAKFDTFMQNDPGAIPNNVNKAMADANDFMATKPFKDSLASDYIKNLAKLGVIGGATLIDPLAPIVAPYVADPLIDKTVDKIGRRFDQPGSPPPLTSQEAVPFLMMALKECRDPSSSFGQKFCPEFEKRLNVDASEPVENQPAVRQEKFQAEVAAYIKKADPELAAILESTKGAQELQQKLLQLIEMRSGQLKEQVQKLTDAIQTQQSEKLKQITAEISRSNLAAAFKVFGVVAQVTGNAKAAHIAHDIGDITLAIHDFANLGEEMAKAGPAMVANIYVGILVLAYDLTQSAEADGMQAVMREIRAIYEFMVGMRREILGALQDFRFSMDLQLSDIAAKLNAAAMNTEIANSFLKVLNQKIDALQAQVAVGFDSLSRVDLLAAVSDCTHEGRISEQVYRLCRDKFALLAQGGYRALEAESGPQKSFEIVRSHILPWLAGYENAGYVPDPNMWLWGKYYLNVMNSLHPEMARLKGETTELVGFDVGLAQVEATRQHINDFVKTMAIDSQRHLRDDVFESLIAEYGKTISGLIDDIDLSRRGVAQRDPLPAQDFEASPPPTPTPTSEYGFLAPGFTITRCEDGKTVDQVAVDKLDSEGYRLIIDVDGFRKGVREWAMKAGQFHTDGSFLPLIPNPVLWALHSKHYRGAELKMCFNKIRLPYVAVNARDPRANCFFPMEPTEYFHAELDVTIQLIVTYPDPDNPEVIHILDAGNLTGSTSQDHPICNTFSSIQPPADLLWNGGTIGHLNGLPGTEIGAAVKNATGWLKYDLPKDQDRLTAFKHEYADFLAREKDKIKSSVAGPLKDANAKIANIRAALIFLVKYGVDTDDPSLDALMLWLSDPFHLPSGDRYVEAMLDKGFTPRDLSAYNQKMVSECLDYVTRLRQARSLRPGPKLLAN